MFSGRKTKTRLRSERVGELRDDHKLAEFESSADYLFTERSDVVLVSVPDPF